MDDQARSDLFGEAVAECNHLVELVSGIHVQQRKGNRPRIKSLLRQPQHDGRVFADGVEHHRILKFGDRFAEYFNALGFEHFQMSQTGRIVDLRHVNSSLFFLRGK
jgi:hypothetical protein